MSKAVHGNPKWDEEARLLIKDLETWAMPDMQKQLNADILTKIIGRGLILVGQSILTRATRSKQSPKGRNQLSGQNTA